jgi:hypothetical protein
MIKIERNNLDDIAKEYFRKIKNKNRQNKNRQKNNLIVRTYFIEHLEELVLAKKEDFDAIEKVFERLFNMPNAECFNEFKTYMENQYKAMRDEYGYWLFEKLDIKVCPYCNRHYTFTINKNNKKISPQLDHFYPKSIYPYLALSFYNLIPSCSVCNHVKLEKKIDIHPYTNSFHENNCHFQIVGKQNGASNTLDWLLKNEIKVHFTGDNKNIEVFALKELYNEHIDYVEEILNKVQAYNKGYYNSLIKGYKLGAQPVEIDRLIFGTYLEDAEHEKRPLSKLTKDILDQIGLKKR